MTDPNALPSPVCETGTRPSPASEPPLPVGPIRVFDARGGLKMKGYPATPQTDEGAELLPQALWVSTWAWHARRVLGIHTFPDALVRYGEGVVNAFSNPPFLVFGQGDKEVFGDFAKSLEVFVHEVAHQEIDRLVNLMWMNQPGAIGEHLADVFAACVRRDVVRFYPQHLPVVAEATVGVPGDSVPGGSTAEAALDWRLGSDLFLDGRSCLRDMMNPGTAYADARIGKDPQVGHMADYRRMREDRGGVHVNSGIPSRAFALYAQEVGDLRALGVWRRAMGWLEKDGSLARWRDLTVRAADGEEFLVAAWAVVGL
jgi:Zn-dependent metalloprotease